MRRAAGSSLPCARGAAPVGWPRHLVRSAARGRRTGGGPAARTAHGTTATTPTSTGPSPTRQLPPSASVRGTVTAARRRCRGRGAIEYRPVIVPTRSGNQCLTTTGIRTLLTAMPASASALAAGTRRAPAKGRTARPAVMAAMPASTTGAGPQRRASRGAVTAEQRRSTAAGTEVRARRRCRSCRGRRGPPPAAAPRLVMAGRRLSAASTHGDDDGAGGAAARRLCRGRLPAAEAPRYRRCAMAGPSCRPRHHGAIIESWDESNSRPLRSDVRSRTLRECHAPDLAPPFRPRPTR